MRLTVNVNEFRLLAVKDVVGGIGWRTAHNPVTESYWTWPTATTSWSGRRTATCTARSSACSEAAHRFTAIGIRSAIFVQAAASC